MRTKLLVLVMVVFVLAGCESKKQEQVKFQGVTQKSDYIAEAMQSLADADIPSAIRSFDAAIKADPTNVANYMTLGQVYLRLKNPDSAADTFSAATKVDPTHGEAFYMLALSLGLQGDKFQEAVKAAQRSAEVFRIQQNEEKFKEAIVLLQGLAEQAAKVAQGGQGLSEPVASSSDSPAANSSAELR